MKNLTASKLITHSHATGSLGNGGLLRNQEQENSGAEQPLYFGMDANTQSLEEAPENTDEAIWNLINDKLSAKGNAESTCNSILEVRETTFSYTCIYPVTGVQMTYRVPFVYNEATFELSILWGQLVTQSDEFNGAEIMYKQ